MTEREKISVIIPVYNVEAYLPQCLDSVLGQTYGNLEILCVDDGATDRSGEILDRYAERDSRMRVFHTKNAGISAARNLALEQAEGTWVLFVDGDDWIDPETCEKALEQQRLTGADLVMWPYIREFPDRSAPKVIFLERRVFEEADCRQLHRRMIGPLGQELARPENADALCTAWGKLYRRDWIRDRGLRFVPLERIGSYEDGLFNLYYLAAVRRAVYVPAYWNHYRKGTGVTATFRPRLRAQWGNLFAQMQQYLTQNRLGSDFQQALNNRISLSIIGLGLNALALPKGQARREVREILSDPVYRAAIRTLPMGKLPLHWWVFFVCCKLRFSAGVFFLLNCMKRVMG